jgi:hypothetical protein
LKELKKAVEDRAVRIYRIKFRLGADYDAAEAGGYRDVLINMAFPPKDGEEEDGLHLVGVAAQLGSICGHQKRWRARQLLSRANFASV